jgi:hypothetical protein
MRTPIESIEPNPEAEPRSFYSLAQQARSYLLSHKWCKSIKRGYLDIGWEGILGVFYFELEPAHEGVDDTLWVIVGDIPSAYICNEMPDGPNALAGYCREMQRWVDAAMAGESVEELIPVNVPPTPEWAAQLGGRLEFIRRELLSECKDQLLRENVNEARP